MGYGIRLANGSVQPITESTTLTNEQVDGLLGGGAELVVIDDQGHVQPVELLDMLDRHQRESR